MSRVVATERAAITAVDDRELVTLLTDLVRIPSPNPPGDEQAVVDVVASVVRAAGLTPVLGYVAPNRPNLEVTIGDQTGRTLLLNAHTDTMPAGTGWTHPPYAAVIEQARLYGLGAADTKAGLAAMVEAVLALRRSGVELRGQLILEAVIDEEAGGGGVQHSIDRGRKADWAIVAEPTELGFVSVGNGQVDFEVIVQGVASHAASPEEGRNAISDAAALVTAIETETARLRERPYPGLGPVTYKVGTIDGGLQTSIVPATCRFTVDRRLLPGQSVADASPILTESSPRWPHRDRRWRLRGA